MDPVGNGGQPAYFPLIGSQRADESESEWIDGTNCEGGGRWACLAAR